MIMYFSFFEHIINVFTIVSDFFLGLLQSNKHAWVIFLLSFLLPMLESALFFGFIFPGETAIILMGVYVSIHRYPIYLCVLLPILGAIIGDYIGYMMGIRFGRKFINRIPHRIISSKKLMYIEDRIAHLGGKIVFTGRFTALLRAIIPLLCGVSSMDRRVFLKWNIFGGIVWGSLFPILGYIVGISLLDKMHKYIPYVTLCIFLYIAILFIHELRKKKRIK